MSLICCKEQSVAEIFKKNSAKTGNAANQSSDQQLKGSAVINVTSDNMEYVDGSNKIVATGHVIMHVDQQDTILEADKVTYDRDADQIIAENNVKLKKNKQIIYGDYTRIDLIRNSVLIDKPNTELGQLKIEAKTAKIYPQKEGSKKNDIDVTSGNATINDKNLIYILSSSGAKYIVPPPRSASGIDSRFKPTYNIHSKNIKVIRDKNRDVITLYSSTVKVNRYKIAYIPSMTITKDGESAQMESNLPEIGHYPDFGYYYGLGHVFVLPNAATIKAVPLLTKNDDFGIGGLLRLRTSTNTTQGLYSSAGKTLVLEGEQKVTLLPDAKILYGVNSYVDNGFLWRQKHKKIVEFVDNRQLLKNENYGFDLRSSAAYIEKDPHWGTARFQLQGDFHNNVPIFNITKYLQVGESAQFNIAAYGNGETYGVLRAGPTLSTLVGPLSIWAAYYQGGIYGNTPIQTDAYYYGKSNVTINSQLKLHRYVSLQYYGSYNLSKDNWDNSFVGENRFYCIMGPDDIKIRIGYDTKRKDPTVDVNMLLGADRSKVEFDKMKVTEK